MPNSIDFRADQIQTKQIIVTGSGAGTTKLLIYGIEAQGSPVNEGLINQAVFPSDTTIGSDVFLYVSGALNTKGSATKRGTSVFGGDLVVSGSLYNGLVTGSGGTYSHAEGENTLASGDFSHAEGSGSIASGGASHAEGQLTLASGIYAHAEGYLTTASAYASHAEGQNTTAGRNGSHAEGLFTSTGGDYSHTEGYQTQTTGAYSHAQGSGSITWGIYSFAAGNRTIASGSVDVTQAAFGRFNKRNNTTSLFVVGNGTGDANVNRKDLFSVDSINQEGIVKINGGISYKVGYLYYVLLSSIDYTLTLEDYLVIVNVTDGGPFSVYLPASATTPLGTTYVIRRYDGSASLYNNYVNVYSQAGNFIISSEGVRYNSGTPLIISGNAGVLRGGSITLTYIGNYYDSVVLGTHPTWMTTSELDI